MTTNCNVNKDTQLCISIASHPSNFGTTLHNAAYAALGLNFVYKSFAIIDLPGALIGVRALNIRGCSVSMPFKEAVIPLLDELDETARAIGAVNTVVNEAGKLKGYNTDAIGAYEALRSIGARPGDNILLLGAGGVARAILFALRQAGFRRVQVANRDPRKIEQLNSILPCDTVLWDNRHHAQADLLINATSLGMSPNADCTPMEAHCLHQTKAVMDVVVSPMETRLIAAARSIGLAVAPGHYMSLMQAIAQFKLYTGEEPPRALLQSKLRELSSSPQ